MKIPFLLWFASWRHKDRTAVQKVSYYSRWLGISLVVTTISVWLGPVSLGTLWWLVPMLSGIIVAIITISLITECYSDAMEEIRNKK
jgi:membrane glycosyltransferase